MAEKKTPSETSSGVPATMPGRNGGTLRRGGINRGGPGRPPSAIRAACREDFDNLRPLLGKIAKRKSSKNADRIRAIDVLGKYGMDATVRVADVKHALRETQRELYDFFPREQADAIMAKIRPHWLAI